MNKISTSINQLPTEYIQSTVGDTDVAPSLPFWLDVLCTVCPPRDILVVGAGSGTGPWIQWLKRKAIHAVWLIEGDEIQHQYLQNNLLTNSSWNTVRTIVAHSPEPTSFYCASNPAESSLIDTELLHGLWPNLRTRQKNNEEAPTTLDFFANEVSSSFNWLILDCLPAARLLRGGEKMLKKLDLALIRTVANEKLISDPGATLIAADKLLQAAGLKQIAVQPERNPSIAHALYIRDTSSQLEKALKARNAQAKHSEQLQIEVGKLREQQDAIVKDRDKQAKQVEQLQIEANKLTQLQDQIIKYIDEQAVIIRERDDLKKELEAVSSRLKLLLIREGDLEELQDRYSELISDYREQQELLNQLSAKSSKKNNQSSPKRKSPQRKNKNQL